MSGEDDIPQQVRTAWLEILGIGDCQVDDNFFELGGDSLAAVLLVARLQEELDREVSLETLFMDGTLAGLTTSCQPPRDGVSR
jgi:acyl carrier protein